MTFPFRTLFLSFSMLLCSVIAHAQPKTVLVFVPYENTYYSEFIVVTEALLASGYSIDLRSAGADSASVYMIPAGTTIEETAGTLPGGSYAQFQQQFLNHFGTAWNHAKSPIQPFLKLNGSILTITDMSNYAALVVVGGTGALDYRIDGTFATQGTGNRTLLAQNVQAAAEKLQALALDALQRNKPVMAQCHAASLPSFWRIPGTSGTGAETLGISLLKNQPSAGFPEAQTSETLAELSVIYRPDDRVVVASPNPAFSPAGNGTSRIITTRDWYPQTVAFAARTLLTMLETYPGNTPQGTDSLRVLLLHGGAVNTGNCGPGNRNNDVPCNYGGGTNLPADFTDLRAVFQTTRPDGFRFHISDWNLLERTLPTTTTEILSQLNAYDVVVFFKHWSNGISDSLQRAIITFADNGGGVLALHHGLYNDIDGIRSKNLLVNELFLAESAMNSWSANLTQFRLLHTNYGHFIGTYGVSPSPAVPAPGFWFSSPPHAGATRSFSTYPNVPLFDELYNNLAFLPSASFGREINQITPLFSNDQTPAVQSHTAGFTRRVDLNNDGRVGRIVYTEPGERKESFQPEGNYAQIIRNAAVWAANGVKKEPTSREYSDVRKSDFRIHRVYPNPFNPSATITVNAPGAGTLSVSVYSLTGQKVLSLAPKTVVAGMHVLSLNAASLSSGMYLLRAELNGQITSAKIVLSK